MIKKSQFIILNKVVYKDYDLILEALSDDGYNISFFAKNGVKKKLINYLQIGNVIKATYTQKNEFSYFREVDLDIRYNFSFYRNDIKNYYFLCDIISITRKVSKHYSSNELYLNLLNTLVKAQLNTNELLNYYNDFLSFCLSLLGINLSIINLCDMKLLNNESCTVFFNLKTKQLSLVNESNVFNNLKQYNYNSDLKKVYLQNLFLENISNSLKLKF